MKKAAGLIIKYFIMYLSCLFPRSRKVYIFGAWLGEQYADNPKYMFLEANRHKEIRPIWITKDPNVCRKVRLEGYEAYEFSSLKGIFWQLRAKYVIMCNGISDVNHMFMGRAVFLNLWHGVPLKKVGYDDFKVKNWDSRGQKIRRAIQEIPLGKEYVVATSEDYAKIYQSAFRRPASQIITMGQPRNDLFYDEEGLFHKEHKLLKAAKGKKIILYTPTHRKEGSVKFPLMEQFDFERLNRWCVEHEAVFVIKRHFYHQEEPADVSKYSNIADITRKSMDIQQLLLDTDLLITDYSSTYIDYLLLDRPLMFYHFDYEDYLESDREMYYDYEQVTPGYKACNFEQLMEELERIFRGEDKFEDERRRVRDLFYCKEGQQAVGEKLLEILKTL
jgi:CDP-glycerol glycerophosphotransferase